MANDYFKHNLQTVLVAKLNGIQIAVIGTVSWESERLVVTTRLYVRTLYKVQERILTQFLRVISFSGSDDGWGQETDTCCAVSIRNLDRSKYNNYET